MIARSSFNFFHVHIAITTTTAMSFQCPKCGITKKSGIISCCGRGGSWFGKCGSNGGIKLGHTWHEGLQACKARPWSETGIRQQLRGARQERNGFSHGNNSANSNTAITAVNAHIFASAPMPDAPPTSGHTLVNSSTVRTTAKINSTANTVAMVTIISVSERSPRSYNSSQVLTTTPEHDPLSSQGCEHLLDISMYTNLLLFVVVFNNI